MNSQRAWSRLLLAVAVAWCVGGLSACKKTDEEAKNPDEAATAAATPETAAPPTPETPIPPVDELPAPPEPDAKVEVPDFTGKPIGEAMKEAVRAGLVAQIGEARRQDAAAPGAVIGQKPAKGEKVDRLSTVELIPRKEPPPPVEMVEIPSVVGRPLAQARALLFEKGFTPRTGKPKFTGKTPGLVLDQNPDARHKAPRGSTVELIPEKQSVVIPDLRKLPLVDAILKVRKVDLDWEGSSEVTTKMAAGSIFDQHPKPGTRAEEGTEIKLTVAKAPPSAPGTPRWCSNFDDLRELNSKDISEVTRLLGKVMPKNYVSALQLEPGAQAHRWSGEHITVSFSYATEHGNDVMILVVPMSGGKEVKGGSGLKFRSQPDGKDTFRGSLTVYTQTPVVVDELRVIMYDLRVGHFFKTIHQARVPVQIRFSPPK